MKDQFDEMGEKLFNAALSARPGGKGKNKRPTASQIIGAALREAYMGKAPCESCTGRFDAANVVKCENCGFWACPECLGGDCCLENDDRAAPEPRIGDEP